MTHLLAVAVPVVVLAFELAAGYGWTGVSPYADVTCQAEGYLCSTDCSTLYYCTKNANGGFTQTEIHKCDTSTGLYCNNEKAVCTTTPSTCSVADGTFRCTGAGYFPDPYDCTLYHVCFRFENAKPEFISIINEHCDPGFAYDPLTTTCRFTLTDPICTQRPVPICKNVLQNGPLASNPSMFYICSMHNGKLEPDIYECPNNQVYVSGVGCTSAGVTTTVPTPTNLPPVWTGCPGVGVFPDPVDCRRYYICDRDLRARHYTCCYLYHYSTYKGRCVFGTC